MKEFRQKYEVFLNNLMEGNEYSIYLNGVHINNGKKIKFVDDDGIRILSEDYKLLSWVIVYNFNSLEVHIDEGTTIKIKKIKEKHEHRFEHEIHFKEIRMLSYYDPITKEDLYPFEIEAREKLEEEKRKRKEKEKIKLKKLKEEERERKKYDWLPSWQKPLENKVKVS